MASITGYTKAQTDILLALLAPLASPALTGNPTAPTQTAGNNSTRVATTAFVQAAVSALVNAAPGALDTLKELADAIGDDANYAATMTSLLAAKAPLASPAFSGTPSLPTGTTGVTQANGDSSTKLATTAFVQTGKTKSVNSQVGTTYTLVIGDAEKLNEASNASAIAVTIPPNSSVAFPIGTFIQLTQIAAGKPSFAAGAGVTINAPGGLLGCRVQWSTITARKRGTDLWVLSDDVG